MSLFFDEVEDAWFSLCSVISTCAPELPLVCAGLSAEVFSPSGDSLPFFPLPKRSNPHEEINVNADPLARTVALKSKHRFPRRVSAAVIGHPGIFSDLGAGTKAAARTNLSSYVERMVPASPAPDVGPPATHLAHRRGSPDHLFSLYFSSFEENQIFSLTSIPLTSEAI